ncbi:serine hydrolase domain-containing protein [Tenacibaculum agarivorans]|uniref:serine hydrolase domain-containing protein n=1 Tax=Tenacibaculum agarivorans TaxID=1908389 RepID=UPI000A7F4933|nr:serine hydrolase domain-containing protein [Tenacibaculum agarivorans]
MRKLILFLITLVMIGCQTQTTKSKEEKKNTNEKNFAQLINFVDTYANETLQKGNINAIGLAVYKNGEIYHNYYGAINEEKGKPNDSTHFEIASISKVFAGSLVAKAVLENKIKLEDDIRKYLKGEYPNLEFEGVPITIKNLLTHTLGFKERRPPKMDKIWNDVSKGEYENKSITYAVDDFLEELKNVELDKKPGTYYMYNSVGSEILAYILEQVYQDSFENILDKFLKEMDIHDSYLEGCRPRSEHIIDGYDENGQLASKTRNILLGAGGSMIATLPDLIKFMKFQLESKNPLIKESTKELYLDREGDKTGYLWDVGYAKEEGFYYKKTGTSDGVQSVILICPDTNYGLILIMNNTSEKAYRDWANLYNRVEVDLIKFPRKNLVSVLKKELLENTDASIIEYKKHIKNESEYFAKPGDLNRIGYQLLRNSKVEEAIKIFKLMVDQFPENSNVYDSLGEGYFTNKEYNKALKNYEKSFVLDSTNTNAEKYILKIKKLLE